MQRAYDQIIHDVCIQNLPVLFCLDRAGIVGADGATHTGMFDIAYLRCLPNLTIMAPKDESELRDMLATAFRLDGPSAIRYPRGSGEGLELNEVTPLAVGKAELLVDGDDGLLITVGTRAADAVHAAEQLQSKPGIRFAVLNLRFIKPLDVEAIRTHLKPGKPLVVVEEGVALGGIGEAIATLALTSGWQGSFAHIGMPDIFPEHGTQNEILRDLKLDSSAIAKRLREVSGL
jgi:1-deoxy-D-xylulose-5-phosphate synthase